jgi:hypothetical protein
MYQQLTDALEEEAAEEDSLSVVGTYATASAISQASTQNASVHSSQSGPPQPQTPSLLS